MWFTKNSWKQAVFFFNDFLLSYIHSMVTWKILPNFIRHFYEVCNLLHAFRWFLRRRSFLSFNKPFFIKNIKILAFALKMLSVLWSRSWLLWNHCFTIPASHRIFYRQRLNFLVLKEERKEKKSSGFLLISRRSKKAHMQTAFLPLKSVLKKVISFYFSIIHRLFFFLFFLWPCGEKKERKPLNNLDSLI